MSLTPRVDAIETKTDTIEVSPTGAGSPLYVDRVNGRVGIGTTSPAGVLHAFTASGACMILQKNNDAPALQFLTTNSKDWNISYTDTTNGRLAFYNHGYGAQVMTLQQDGNVGIGTASPNTKLDVAATNAKTTTGYWHQNITDLTSATTGVGGGLTFVGYKTSTSAQGVFASIEGYKANSTGGNEQGELRFHTNDGSALVERMTIDSSGNININNKLSMKGQSSNYMHVVHPGEFTGTTGIDIIAQGRGGGFFVVGTRGSSSDYRSEMYIVSIDQTPTVDQAICGTAGGAVGATFSISGGMLRVTTASAATDHVVFGMWAYD